MTHICFGKLKIIASDNGLSPGRRLTIIWTNAGILLIEPLGTKFNRNWNIFIQENGFGNVVWKMLVILSRPQCVDMKHEWKLLATIGSLEVCAWFCWTFLRCGYIHYDVIKWTFFPRYWPFVRRIHRSPVTYPHKGQWHGALMFS